LSFQSFFKEIPRNWVAFFGVLVAAVLTCVVYSTSMEDPIQQLLISSSFFEGR